MHVVFEIIVYRTVLSLIYYVGSCTLCTLRQHDSAQIWFKPEKKENAVCTHTDHHSDI